MHNILFYKLDLLSVLAESTSQECWHFNSKACAINLEADQP